MRAALVAMMLMFGSQAGAESEVSGMLACNPNKTGAKPVIYAFDGKYLLRDNQKKTPFQHIASIAGFLEIYFAFVPSYTMNMRQQEFERFTKLLNEQFIATKEILEGPEGTEYIAEFVEFQNWCSSNPHMIVKTPGPHSSAYGVQTKYNDYLIGYFLNITERSRSRLTCENTKGKVITDFIKWSGSKSFSPIKDPYENVDVSEFDQFKVTVDLKKMTVRQEIYRPLGKGFQKDRIFDAEEFRCQSLGIDVPEIDVSESITPIGKGI